MNNKIEQKTIKKKPEKLLDRINYEINNKNIKIIEGKIIDDFDTFLELVSAIDKLDDRELFFRGQSNASDSGQYQKWNLESSFKRRQINKKTNYKKLRNITLDLLNYLGDKKNEHNKKLEFLSEMKHYGVPTILLDFTPDFKTALWFSASVELKKEKDNEEFFNIFIFELIDNVRKNILNENDLENDFNNNIYLCPLNLNRGLAQRSHFLLDTDEDIKEKLKIIQINISYKIQKKVMEYLHNKQITAETLFPDLSGLYKTYEEFGGLLNLAEEMSNNKDNNYDETEKNKEEEIFEKIIKLEPGLASIYNDRGIFLLKSEEYDEAIKQFQKAIELNPNYAEAYNKWGIVLSERKKYEEAIEKYQKAIQINPNYAKAYNNWGIVLNDQKEYEKAIENYEKAIQINPNYAEAYNNWGIVLNEQKKYEEAIEKYQKAIQISPNSQITYILLSGLIENGMNLNMDQINDLIEVLNKNSKLINDKNLIGKINDIKNKLLEKKKNL